MELVNCTCKACGAKLEINKYSRTVKCDYCDTVFVVNDSNSNSSTNSNRNENFLERFERAEVYRTKMHDLKKAWMEYQFLALNYPDEYIVWWNLTLILTDELTNFKISDEKMSRAQNNFNKAVALASKGEAEKMTDKWTCFAQDRKAFREPIEAEIKRLNEKISQVTKESFDAQKKFTKAIAVVFLLAFLTIFVSGFFFRFDLIFLAFTVIIICFITLAVRGGKASSKAYDLKRPYQIELKKQMDLIKDESSMFNF